ncbi:TDP-N-acetylfucosamine:lipid II N-acetylfucosaminyltransferase [Planococcus sp. 1R117A]|uniref:TDP-N-acetylfucosamine:lipid II N-acetylfucosaminyltransferase n=1 Tax=Planococcus sp. 1R117A TaxID=3447020 RepID=UPI003EDC0BD4
MKHLHLVSTDKFIEPFIEFINKNFNVNEHRFLSFTISSQNHITKNHENLSFEKKFFGNINVLSEVYRAESIYIHSLFSMKLVIFFFFQPWLLRKCNWIVWGKDLYIYKNRKDSLKTISKEFIRRFVIKRFGNIVTLVKGDYDLAEKWYSVRGKYHHGAYINPITKKFLDSLPTLKKEQNTPLAIQIGNSADPTNKHIEAFKRLERFKDENIKVFVPLSYGDKKYAQEVILEGERIFGDKFIPLIDFLPPSEYSNYLNSIDIAIFNNNRQQALGNIYALLYLNKKVILRSDTSMSNHFIEKFDIHLEDALNINNLKYSDFIIKEKQNNKMKISCVFEESYLAEVWKKIFEK